MPFGFIAAAASVFSLAGSRKARKGQERTNEAIRKANVLRNKQSKRQFLKNFRQAQANVYSQAIAAGVGLDSSAFQGTRSSQSAQAGTAIREFREFDKLGAEQTSGMNQAALGQFQAGAWGAVANFAASFIPK